MKTYKVVFESNSDIFEHSFNATGRTAAEDKAESLIKERFFANKDVIHFFYILEEIDTGRRRVLKVCNKLSPPRN